VIPVLRRLKREAVDVYWAVRGPLLRLPDFPNRPKSVLFVCKGNICRSPFAERVAAQLPFSSVKFGSAGLHVRTSIASPNGAIEAAHRFGVDLLTHRSQRVTEELLASYDLIVPMEAWHYMQLSARFPAHRSKLYLMTLLDPHRTAKHRGYAAFNVRDPYGGSPGVFDACFEELRTLVECLSRRVGH
jgi:protein-tyrosine phosphatase